MKRINFIVGIIVLCVSVGLFIGACPPPVAIIIEDVSLYGDMNGTVSGYVTGLANPTNYVVAGYIEVEGPGVIWTKPYYNQPHSPINEDGTWSIDITTGGNDRCATKVYVFLLPLGAEPVICSPCHGIPDLPDALASDMVKRGPELRTIHFAGYDWIVKSAPICQVGPGPNYFTDRVEDVYVDEEGQIHLWFRNYDGKWWSAEVICTESFGYGTYTFVFNFRADLLDPNEIAAAFIWDNSAPLLFYREIDFIEFALWGIIDLLTNAQFVVHPCTMCPGCANCSRFTVDLTDQDQLLTLKVVWQPNEAHFRIYHGDWAASQPPSNTLIHEWSKIGGIPDPGQENVRFNAWLFNGQAPLDGLEREMVIKDFVFSAEIPICGNNILEAGEECDDGNTIDGDGCSSQCIIETEPGIAITGVSLYGDLDGWVWGEVAGYDPDMHGVAVYIKVRGGWWNKPYWAWPVTAILSNLTWRCDIVTGGVDQEATEVRAYLIPNSYTPPQAAGGSSFPVELEENALDWTNIIRTP